MIYLTSTTHQLENSSADTTVIEIDKFSGIMDKGLSSLFQQPK